MRALRGRGVVTPDVAQQAGVLPDSQRQHDRKESCSKHVMLTTLTGKSYASLNNGRWLVNPRIFDGLHWPDRGTCGISPVGAENPPVRIGTLPPTCRPVSRARLNGDVMKWEGQRYSGMNKPLRDDSSAVPITTL